MAIDREFIVQLKGKDFPLYAGVLDAATKAGLRSLTTRIIQLPGPENGHMAVVMARAEFEGDRVFEDVGDASPASTSPALAPAVLRLASTRAKGRALRDGINVGGTMFEELPDLDAGSGNSPGPPAPAGTDEYGVTRANQTERRAPEGEPLACSEPGCGKPLTVGQRDVSTRSYGQPLCPAHQRQHNRIS